MFSFFHSLLYGFDRRKIFLVHQFTFCLHNSFMIWVFFSKMPYFQEICIMFVYMFQYFGSDYTFGLFNYFVIAQLSIVQSTFYFFKLCFYIFISASNSFQIRPQIIGLLLIILVLIVLIFILVLNICLVIRF